MSLARLAADPVSTDELESEVKSICQKIVSACSPQEIWLFGSLAREKMSTASDIDIAVILAPENDMRAARKAVYGKGPLSHWPLDLLFFDQTTFEKKKVIGGVCFVINEEGKRMYKK